MHRFASSSPAYLPCPSLKAAPPSAAAPRFGNTWRLERLQGDWTSAAAKALPIQNPSTVARTARFLHEQEAAGTANSKAVSFKGPDGFDYLVTGKEAQMVLLQKQVMALAHEECPFLEQQAQANLCGLKSVLETSAGELDVNDIEQCPQDFPLPGQPAVDRGAYRPSLQEQTLLTPLSASPFTSALVSAPTPAVPSSSANLGSLNTPESGTRTEKELTKAAAKVEIARQGNLQTASLTSKTTLQTPEGDKLEQKETLRLPISLLA